MVIKADTALKESLRTRFEDAVAIEMESAGVIQAAHLNRLDAVTIRGISDAAGTDKGATDEQGWQRRAAANAAAFTAALLVTLHSGTKRTSLTGTTVHEGTRQLLSGRTAGSSSDWRSRVSIMGGITYDIESSDERTAAFKVFVRTLLAEFERLPVGVNHCGSEPLREIVIEDYSTRLRTHSRSQMDKLNGKIRWYWRGGAPRSFNYEPPIYESVEAATAEERRLLEFRDSDLIISLGGRIGTRSGLEQLLDYHRGGTNDVNLIRTPTILLGWFGGSTKEFIDAKQTDLTAILQGYQDLKPCAQLDGWDFGDTPRHLARVLAAAVRRLLRSVA